MAPYAWKLTTMQSLLLPALVLLPALLPPLLPGVWLATYGSMRPASSSCSTTCCCCS